MMTKHLMTCLLTVLFLLAGPYFFQEEGDMLLASSKSDAQDMMPPMDEKVPAKTETATFALG
jgi:hypothetical protein